MQNDAYVLYETFLCEAGDAKYEENDGDEEHYGQKSIHHVLHPVRLQVHISPVANHQHNL